MRKHACSVGETASLPAGSDVKLVEDHVAFRVVRRFGIESASMLAARGFATRYAGGEEGRVPYLPLDAVQQVEEKRSDLQGRLAWISVIA